MLLVPYFLWVCYLAYLNYGIMVLNNFTYRDLTGFYLLTNTFFLSESNDD